MERAKAFHTIMVEMTTGMLALATLAIIILTWAVLFGQGRKERLRDGLDAVAFFGASLGTAMILLAIFTGFLQWPLQAFLSSVIARNKIFTAVIAFTLWGAFVFLRAAAGKQLWERRGLTLFALILGLAGFSYLVFTASIGGTLAGKPSGFEQLARTIIETRRTFVLPYAVNALLVFVGILLPVLALLRLKRRSGAH